jgi:hypothetical protein
MPSFTTYQNLNIKTLKQLKHLFKRIDPTITIGRKVSAKDVKSYSIKKAKVSGTATMLLNGFRLPQVILPDLKYMLE